MSERLGLDFAGLLRQLRAGARLTQEELAESAGISARSVSDLERGINRTAHKDTAVLLARALNLTGQVAELFVSAARGRVRAADVLAARERDATSAGHNLSAPLTSFVGREQEMAAVARHLGVARLVTLTGTGGVGKTRLAAEVAAGALAHFADGVWLADLVGVNDPGLVPTAVMQALGVRQDGVPAVEALRNRLRSADLLLVLDNCEHLLDACAQLAAILLRAAPGLRVLATSREALGLPGEVVFPVLPLPLPAQNAGEQAIAEAAAVRLFLDRGSAARGGTPGQVAPLEVAGRICRDLDGLPLAIELAAARLGTLSAADIEAQLDDRFSFLAYRRPAADPRHQALRAAMDWSYDLLTAAEQEVFAELSVFAGTFGLAQLAEVCASGDQTAALELIDTLAAKSLVACELSEDGTRYRLLETIRQYAAARLTKTGDPEAVHCRHAVAYLDLARREQDPAVLALELDNFRAALGWALARGDDTGPELAEALGDFWLNSGLLQEGRSWLERVLGQPPAGQRLRASLLRQLGAIAHQGGDLERAEAALAEAAKAAEAAGAAAVLARIRLLLGEINFAHGASLAETLTDCQAATAVLEAEGDLAGLAEAWLLTGLLIEGNDRDWTREQQLEAYERALAYSRQSGHRDVAARASRSIGLSLFCSAMRADEYIPRYEQLLRDAEGDLWAEAHMLPTLVLMYACVGRFDDAREALVRARSLLAGFGARFALATMAAISAGAIELYSGDFAAAERCFREGSEELRAMGERAFRGILANWTAEALYAQGRFAEAQQMNAEAEAAVVTDDLQPQLAWRFTQAKLLAQRGEIPAATQLINQVEDALPPSITPWFRAFVLEAKAEISRLAGNPGQAEQDLNAALRIYEDIGLAALVARAKAAINGLANGSETDL